MMRYISGLALAAAAAFIIVRLEKLMGQVDDLNAKIDKLTETVTEEIAEVKALLQAQDISGALDRLDKLDAAVESISEGGPQPA